ncbi:lyase family protein, partial [Mycobacterium senriense]
MSNLLWPGDHRAGEHMTDEALLESMITAECAWLDALAAAGLAPAQCAGADLWILVTRTDCESLAVTAEDGGNPVIPLVKLLRKRAEPGIAPWIHRGLTSQDVLDTSLMLAVRGVADDLTTQLRQQISALTELATEHRGTPMPARTLTQHAAPTTFGVKAAGWLTGIVDAFERMTTLITPIQIGGAAGTLAASTELAALLTGTDDPAGVSLQLMHSAATSLGLQDRPAWHTARAPVTAVADAFVGCTDAWGRIASDVVTLARPEIAELG